MTPSSFLRSLLPQRSAQPLRAIVATKAESRLARRKAADLRMEFEIMRVHMTDEEFEAAKLRGSERASQRHKLRRRAKLNVRGTV